MKQKLSNILFICIFGKVWTQSAIEISRRVMNGENAKIGQFPYHAIFMHNNQFFCGASVIHKRWALTAAHCLKSNNVNAHSIVVGGINNSGTDGKKYAVQALLPHEKYTSITSGYDIMLIHLKNDIEFNKNVRPIQLPTNNLNQYGNSVAVLSGLGSTSPNIVYPKTMQYAHLRVLPQSECTQVAANTKILDSFVCTYNENRKATCVGDSGGPVVVNGTQVGLVSFGINENCSINQPTVNTRISSHLPWIKNSLNKYNDALPY